MSLVGTRPPTVDEWEKYELHHRCDEIYNGILRYSDSYDSFKGY